MRIELKNSFTKDLKKLQHNRSLITQVYDTIYEIKTCESLSEISELRKLDGYKNYYRIRIGSYRIGVKCIGDKVVFFRILPRGIIYKLFP